MQSADISRRVSDYRHAVADEALAQRATGSRANPASTKALSRRRIWKSREDTEDKAKSTSKPRQEHLHVLGADVRSSEPASSMSPRPISGVITDQKSPPRRGVKSLDIAQSVHHFRSLARLGDRATFTKTICPSVHVGEMRRHPAERLSRTACFGPHQQHRTDSRSQYPHGESAHRDGESRHLMRLGMFVTAHVPRAQIADRARRFRPSPFCICTIAIGCMCPAGGKPVPPRRGGGGQQCFRPRSQESCPASRRAIRW